MQVVDLKVGQLGTNCYLLEDHGEVGIIDPGDDGDFIIRKIEDLGAKPVWIIATHGHFDHVLAVSELALAYQIPLYMNLNDLSLLKRASKTAKYFLGIPTDPILVDPLDLTSKTKIKVGKEKIEVIETPGHTMGSVCLYIKKKKVLFSGDTIFADGIVGRTDLECSSIDELGKSLPKLLKLDKKTVVYPGHGRQTIIEEFGKQFPGLPDLSHKKTRT